MPENSLQFVAVTSSGRAYDIDFPLHPETRSGHSVSELVTSLLAAISGHAERRDDVSDGDILQALAMTLAIRGRMIAADPDEIERLIVQLLASAQAAVASAPSYLAARA